VREKKLLRYNTGRKVIFGYIRVGGAEINANSTVKEIFGHFLVFGRRERDVEGRGLG
jgi:hypothetical protein